MELLKSPPIKIAAKDDIIPSSRKLENEVLPSPRNIYNTVVKLLKK